MPDEAVDKMIEAEPRILDTDISFLLAEITRLLPGQDPKRLLVQNPSVRIPQLACAALVCCKHHMHEFGLGTNSSHLWLPEIARVPQCTVPTEGSSRH